MKGIVILLAVALVLVLSASVASRTWYVPSEQCPTIQAGVDRASGGDTVLVANGVYTGNGNREIDFKGKAILVRSQSDNPGACIIDCQAAARGFYFHTSEGSGSVLRGFTIKNGDASYGGGIYCYSSSPTITNCIISGNSTQHGAGIDCIDASPTISDCIISGNTAAAGAGIWCSNSSITITGCTISGNSATGSGGGMRCWLGSSVVVTSCTIYGNTAHDYSGAMDCGSVESPSSVTVNNTIIVCNSQGFGGPVGCYMGSSVTLSCCDVYDNAGGNYVGCIAGQDGVRGNISEDPLFCDAQGGNYHLSQGSPCSPFTQPNPECDLIGACPVAYYPCAPTLTQRGLIVFAGLFILSLIFMLRRRRAKVRPAT